MIRTTTLGDLTALMQIETNSFDRSSFAMSRQNFIYHINKEAVLYVYEADDTLAGYILVFVRKNSPKARIYSVAVKESYRGQGIATALFEKAISYAKETAKDTITLEVRADNENAIKLYKKLGFKTQKRLKGYYPDKMDALTMELFLNL
ncbi:MAG: ribosomal protein S18-alanine N-acetyltransferase [Campylobacteraceae bacterium]|jgi:ribosomal-protein-alanine N-acetyltransferase|nr:ribosomal protein S18-alanine N-acetyltransferase [Campylobacteraceae bacterium]